MENKFKKCVERATEFTQYRNDIKEVVNSVESDLILNNTPFSEYAHKIKSVAGMFSLNIDYSQTPPENEEKIWLQTEEPKSIEIADGVNVGLGATETTENAFGTSTSYMIINQGIFYYNNALYYINGNKGAHTFALRKLNLETMAITNVTTTLNGSLFGNLCGCAKFSDNVVNFKVVNVYSGSYSSSTKTIGLNALTDSCQSYGYCKNGSSSLNFSEPPRANGIYQCIGNYMYAIGGVGFSNSYTPNSTFNSSITKVFTLEGSVKSTIGATLSLHSMAYAATGEAIYMFGGITPDGQTNVCRKFENETFTELEVTHNYSGSAAVCVGDFIYIFGGYDGENYTNKIFKYTIASDTMEELDSTLPTPFGNISNSITIDEDNQRIFIAGGYGGTTYGWNLYVFDYKFELLKDVLLIKTDNSNATQLKLINSNNLKLKTGIKSVYKGNSENVGIEVPARYYDEESGTWKGINCENVEVSEQ